MLLHQLRCVNSIKIPSAALTAKDLLWSRTRYAAFLHTFFEWTGLGQASKKQLFWAVAATLLMNLQQSSATLKASISSSHCGAARKVCLHSLSPGKACPTQTASNSDSPKIRLSSKGRVGFSSRMATAAWSYGSWGTETTPLVITMLSHPLSAPMLPPCLLSAMAFHVPLLASDHTAWPEATKSTPGPTWRQQEQFWSVCCWVPSSPHLLSCHRGTTHLPVQRISSGRFTESESLYLSNHQGIKEAV